MTAASNPPSSKFFNITMSSTEEQLHVCIETERLRMESVTNSEEDVDNYADLFGNSDVMEKYASGTPKTKEYVEKRIESWIKRFQDQDPFNGLKVSKKDTGEFIGHVVLGHGDRPGQSELAYLFKKAHWNQGFGTEAITALVNEYALLIIQKGYNLEGRPLEEITATTRPDNPASVKILEKLGFEIQKEEEKYGHTRYHFSKNLSLN